jgi:hypothetical protein
MTAKRFMLDDCGELIDLNNHKFINYGEECCNLLNEQHETIERLKQNVDELLSINVEEELLKETEQLRHDATILIQSNQDYRKENEQLKKALWCIRKRYGYTVEEFIEDLKDNGIDLTKVDLE